MSSDFQAIMPAFAVAATRHTALVNGARLSWQEAGSGAPLLLVHAGVADSRMWAAQMAAFSHRYRVLCPDLRGFGQSDGPPGDYAHHRDLAGLLDELGLQGVVAVGVSIGATAVASLAVARPELVARLGLVSARFASQGASAEVLRYRQLAAEAQQRGDLAAAIEVNLRTWADGPRRAPAQVDPVFRASLADLLAFNLARPDIEGAELPLDPPLVERLAEIRVPTLVVCGAADVADTLRSSELLAERIPPARLVRVPNAAHLLPMERPAVFNQLLAAFLANGE